MTRPSGDPLPLRLCLLVVRLASRIVPAEDRGPWRREWDAELRHRWSPSARISKSGELHMVRRSLGSLVDAAWLRRQLTRDADVIHDAAHGVRMLAQSPGFTAVALLVLAIGIGASTAIASLADALLFRRLPIPNADRVVTLWEGNRLTGVAREDVAPGNAIDWISRPASFAAAAAVEPWSLDFTAPGGEPEVLYSARVSERFFDVIAVPMLHGRAFTAREFTKGNDRVAILSYGVWKERFGGDPSVVGRVIQLDHLPYVLVGVTRPGIDLRLFEARREPRVYLPKYFEAYEPRIRATGYWNVLARLQPGVSLDQARQEMDVLSAALARDYPNSNRNTVAEVVPIPDHLAGSLRPLLPLLLGAAGLLLLVACANAANLMLARGSKVRIQFQGRPVESEVVGIVGDARHDGLDRPGRPELFLAHPQAPFGSMTFVVQAGKGWPASMQVLKQQVWAIDPLQAFYRTATLEDLVSRTLVGRRFSVFLLTGFGAAALLLAASGLYGVMSFSTSQRLREFGVRVALGARPADILSMVVLEGLKLAFAGIITGVVAAVWLTRLLKGLLFGISATDPLTFGVVVAGILLISALSCFVPARRAVRADPLIMLKTN